LHPSLRIKSQHCISCLIFLIISTSCAQGLFGDYCRGLIPWLCGFDLGLSCVLQGNYHGLSCLKYRLYKRLDLSAGVSVYGA
jgi:hypothetical protein